MRKCVHYRLRKFLALSTMVFAFYLLYSVTLIAIGEIIAPQCAGETTSQYSLCQIGRLIETSAQRFAAVEEQARCLLIVRILVQLRYMIGRMV